MGKGLEKLQTAVERDCSKYGGTLHPEGCVTCGAKCFHKYCNKYKWVIDRAKSYGEAMGLHWEDILDGWEEQRNYWYMSYYQDCNQPKITTKNVRVFETMDEYRKALDGKKFRCPSCGKESADPYNCKACGWAVYGLLGDLGKGRFCICKRKITR